MRARRDGARGDARSGAMRWLGATHARVAHRDRRIPRSDSDNGGAFVFLGLGTTESPSLLMHLPYDQGESQHTIAARPAALRRNKARPAHARRGCVATNARRAVRRTQLEQSSMRTIGADAGFHRRPRAVGERLLRALSDARLSNAS
ncbi:hypothetical protein [Burkholderia humptydooensis]|uniref:hypothetical protein n=3 Tax=Burkholderia humptydooensis TaxID=430531 RepID=UPI001FC96C37|nr:hypothetical protein [Burkholderia humptydooensis]